MSQQNTIAVRNWTIAIMTVVALVVLIVVLGLLKDYIWPTVYEAAEFRYERLKPVAKLNISGETIAQATVPEEPRTPKSAQEIYETVCTACHSTGVLNAPKYGDKAGWADRMAKGEATLIQNAINGLNAMPARGGDANLTDAEVTSTVQYMLAAVGAGSTQEASEAEASADSSETKTPTVTPTDEQPTQEDSTSTENSETTTPSEPTTEPNSN